MAKDRGRGINTFELAQAVAKRIIEGFLGLILE
jgi:hypothetical protein